jgi:hypothetical protein
MSREIEIVKGLNKGDGTQCCNSSLSFVIARCGGVFILTVK